MNRGLAGQPIDGSWARWARAVVLLASALMLCSCRGPEPLGSHGGYPPQGPPALPCPAAGAPNAAFASLPAEAYTGVQVGYAGPPIGPVAVGPDGSAVPSPRPFDPAGPWAPPGISQPWPSEEYLADGGDSELAARVSAQREVQGLDVEDTVAHYDTLDGRTLVEPSNQVHVYSPRFRAVRQVVGLQASEQRDRSAGVFLPTKPVRYDDRQTPLASKQNVQAERDVGTRSLTTYRTQQHRDVISTALGPRGFRPRAGRASPSTPDGRICLWRSGRG